VLGSDESVGTRYQLNQSRSFLIEGSESQALLRRCFSFPVLLGAFLLLGVFLEASAFRIDPDTWWHLLVGQHILTTHSWPTADQYSFTVQGAPWIAYEWFGEVIFALIDRAGGVVGLMALLFILTCTLILLIYYYAYLRCRNPKAAFVATVGTLPLAGIWFTLHPQLLGYIFLVLTLICLERFRFGKCKSLWLLPIIFGFWVNTHGTFVLGALAFGIYWLSGVRGFRYRGLVAEQWTTAERKQLAVVALLSAVASCVTPYGTRLAAYPLQLMLFQQLNLSNNTSFQPLPFDTWYGKFFLILILISVVAVFVGEQRTKVEHLALFLLAASMATLHTRMLLLFAIVFAPFFATVAARSIANYDPAKDRHILNALLIALMILMIVRAFPSRQSLERSIANAYPQRGIEYLRGNPPPGRMFNDLTWGGYLLSTLGSDRRVFIDGRLDLYEYGGVFADYLQIIRVSPETFFLMSKYNIGSCFIVPKTPLATLLAASPDWKRVYQDESSILFIRTQ